jgi:hypothetical protein
VNVYSKTIYVEVEAADEASANAIITEAFVLDAHPLNDIPAILNIDLAGPIEETEFTVCEWCAGEGCKSCGFSGRGGTGMATLDFGSSYDPNNNDAPVIVVIRHPDAGDDIRCFGFDAEVIYLDEGASFDRSKLWPNDDDETKETVREWAQWRLAEVAECGNPEAADWVRVEVGEVLKDIDALCGFRWRERAADGSGPFVWRECVKAKGHTSIPHEWPNEFVGTDRQIGPSMPDESERNRIGYQEETP